MPDVKKAAADLAIGAFGMVTVNWSALNGALQFLIGIGTLALILMRIERALRERRNPAARASSHDDDG